MSAYALPSEFELPLANSRKPLVLLLAGCAFRIRSQNAPALTVCVPQTLVSVSLMLGMYLFAYSPAELPPASKPPGLKTSAASPPPHPPNDGIWLTPFLNRPL